MTRSDITFEVVTAKGAVIDSSPDRDLAVAAAERAAERFDGVQLHRVVRTYTETRQPLRWDNPLKLVRSA